MVSSLLTLALLVHATQAALMVYLSVSPQALQGLPVYLRWPFLAALIRGESNLTLLLVDDFLILNQYQEGVSRSFFQNDSFDLFGCDKPVQVGAFVPAVFDVARPSPGFLHDGPGLTYGALHYFKTGCRRPCLPCHRQAVAFVAFVVVAQERHPLEVGLPGPQKAVGAFLACRPWRCRPRV